MLDRGKRIVIIVIEIRLQHLSAYRECISGRASCLGYLNCKYVRIEFFGQQARKCEVNDLLRFYQRDPPILGRRDGQLTIWLFR